jgi:hypothetical protein
MLASSTGTKVAFPEAAFVPIFQLMPVAPIADNSFLYLVCMVSEFG